MLIFLFLSSCLEEANRVHTSGNQVRVEGLLPATIYSLRVQGQNSVGVGPASDPLVGVTEEEQPSSHPRFLMVLVQCLNFLFGNCQIFMTCDILNYTKCKLLFRKFISFSFSTKNNLQLIKYISFQTDEVSSNSITLSWFPPSDNTLHGKLLGYYLGYGAEKINDTKTKCVASAKLERKNF